MKGYTLIELMIVVSMLGIIGTQFAGLVWQQDRVAQDIQSEERAWQVLEYEADAILRRVAVDTAVRDRLVARVPGAKLSSTTSGGVTTLTLTWTTATDTPRATTLAVIGSPR